MNAGLSVRLADSLIAAKITDVDHIAFDISISIR